MVVITSDLTPPYKLVNPGNNMMGLINSKGELSSSYGANSDRFPFIFVHFYSILTDSLDYFAEFTMKGAKSKSTKVDSKLSVKKGVASKKPTKKEKAAAKDPNKPKRPASAFFVFMEEFRKQYKEKHPNNKSVAAVGKAGGDKWKSMSEAEKAPYVAKAEKRKTDYNKQMEAYNRKQAGEGADDDDSDKSRSEVHDEDEESGEEEDDDDDE
ncbi:High mobility group box domain [Dillenia turbinata]|uniref:High mobility group box domain n=1 Tax=Dillenia turbinata TaxID=194707 RepID=A0AAN8Z2V6_9MAGN